MNDINFLPATYMRQQALRKRGTLRLTLLAAALVCLGVWWVVQHEQTAATRRRVEAVEARAEEAKQKLTELQRLRKEHASLVKQVALREELGQPVNHTQVLGVLGRVLPSSVALVEIKMQTVRSEPTPQADPAKAKDGAAKPGKKAKAGKDEIRIELVGLAPDDRTVASLLGALNEYPLFRDAMLRHSRATEVGGRALRNFRLTLRVDLGVEYKPSTAAGEIAHAG